MTYHSKILSPENIAICEGKLCPYCKKETELTGSARVYKGVNRGMIYYCEPCQAWVKCHKDSTKALGRVAKVGLRSLKSRAHDAFDPIWEEKFMSRHKAYDWLSEQLDWPRAYTHIGMFSERVCKKVINISNQYLKDAREQRKKAVRTNSKVTPGLIQEILLQKRGGSGARNLQRESGLRSNGHKGKGR